MYLLLAKSALALPNCYLFVPRRASTELKIIADYRVQNLVAMQLSSGPMQTVQEAYINPKIAYCEIWQSPCNFSKKILNG